jgi:transposase-like protein
VWHAGRCRSGSELNKKVYSRIEQSRNRKLEREYPYVYLDGMSLKRSWGGEVRNVSVLVAIDVAGDGFPEVLGVCEGARRT